MDSRVADRLLERLRNLRLENGLTQEAFSELSKISYKYYQAIEGGRRKDLRLSTLERLARAYGLELWELFAPEMPTCRLMEKAPRYGTPHYKSRQSPVQKKAAQKNSQKNSKSKKK